MTPEEQLKIWLDCKTLQQTAYSEDSAEEKQENKETDNVIRNKLIDLLDSLDNFFFFSGENNFIWNAEDCKKFTEWLRNLKHEGEPKFCVGDTVVINDADNSSSKKVFRIIEARDGKYTIEKKNGKQMQADYTLVESNFRKWSIEKDTKPGDVLTCYSESKGKPIEQTGIIKQYVGKHGGCSNCFEAYFGIDWDNNVIIDGYMGSAIILPATEEQQENLFKKMKESGYSWDSNKQILIKSNFKPIFCIGDKLHCGDITQPVTITGFRDDAYITDSAYGVILFSDQYDWDLIEDYDRDLDKIARQNANKAYPPEYEMPDDNWKQRAGYITGFKDACNEHLKFNNPSQEQMMKNAIDGFLVRDKDDYAAIYSEKPHMGKTEWIDGTARNSSDSSWICNIKASMIPDLDFSDEPVKVKLLIIKDK